MDGVSFHIDAGEVYGLVGESGSGKTTIGRSLIRIYKPTEGRMYFNGMDISKRLSRREYEELTGKMQMIFQDPMSSLNPSKKVYDLISQGLRIHHRCRSRAEEEHKVYEIMDLIGLSAEYANRYPGQFSGGQRQRIAIARALIMEPEFVIADEPISALDVSIQAQIVNLLKQLQKKLGISILFIAHDLAMVQYISDRIGVMHMGHIVETGTTEEIFSEPVHPYTRSLLSAIPKINPGISRKKISEPYDQRKSGIDYTKGEMHLIKGTHEVLATDTEYARWIGA